LVEDALIREEESYRFRAGSIDTKAGLLLGAAGIVVALVGNEPGVAELAAQLLAAGSGVTAALTLWPRVDKGIAPRSLRDRYLTADLIRTRLVLLNTRLELHAKDESQLIRKARHLRLAAALLLAATATLVAGGIVSAV